MTTTDPTPSMTDAEREVWRERFARAAREPVRAADMAPVLAVLVEALETVNTAHAQLLAADGLLETLFGYLATGERGHPGEAARRTGWISQRRIDELGERLRAWRASWAPTGSAVS
ncbi:hypothetical protein [Amycolatopsis sp. cmx-11-32]|uniref:hypothetical protein n=1 Tax=Amycolatopsis sp. cmx-11-32 TaxID=2785796 RepID=UPI0039E40445